MASGVRLVLALALALAQGALAAEMAPFDLQGHRGARGLAPENTMAAFRRALEIGVSTIETDVAITRDRIAVVSHDPLLNPDLVRDASGAWITQKGVAISSLTFAELRTYDIGRLDPRSSYAKGFALQRPADGERFPALRELLQLVREHSRGPAAASGQQRAPVELNIETKITPDDAGQTQGPATFVRIILDEVRTAGLLDRVTVQSFDWRTLLEAKKIEPKVRTSCLTIETTSNNTMAAGTDGRSPWHAGLALADYGSVPGLVKAAGCSIWSPFFRNVTPELVAKSHALGLRVLPWTVNDPADMRRMIDQGVDGLITDYPDRLREILEQKGMPLR